MRIGPPTYALTPIAAACDPAEGPGETTPPESVIPFAFRYFGETVGAWSLPYPAYSPGALRLWVDASPDGSTSTTAQYGVPRALPSPQAPGRLLASFWDRAATAVDPQILDASSGPEPTPSWWRDVAAPARHLTVAWPSVWFAGSTDRVSLQVKLYADTDVIEFHVCGARGSTHATASTAFIGMQNATGSDGVWVASQSPVVRSPTGWRFTPRR